MDKTMKKELGIVGLIFVLLMFFEGYFFGNVINLNKDLGVFISIFGCLFLIMFLIAYIIVNNRIKMLDNKEILIENYTLKNEYNIIKTNDKYYLLEDDQVIIRAKNSCTRSRTLPTVVTVPVSGSMAGFSSGKVTE